MRKATAPVRAIFSALLVALTASACGSAGNAAPADGPTRATTTIEVRNNNWMDMVVYVVRSGMRVRLGMVNSMNETRFRVPPNMLAAGSSVRLEAHPIGSNQSYVAPPVHVAPGQRIDFTIQNHLAISSISVH